MSDELAVQARGLAKRFGDFQALHGIDLEVPAGSVYAVLGPNGAGKTTTVRILATLLRPTGGSALVFGRDVVREATAVRGLIGLTGQYASVDEALTAKENLVIFGRLYRLPNPGRRADELLERFALTEAADRPISGFSGGMRRRLDIAASLVASPRLIFLDEPTTGLDPRTRVQMWDTVRDLVKQGSTVLLTTQYLEEADQLADQIAVIDRGRLVANNTAEALKASVGASTLHLTLGSRRELRTAAEIIVRVTGIEPVVDRPQLLVPSGDGNMAADVIGALRAQGIDIVSFDVARPSLDDVFFALTGQGQHPGRAEEQEGDDPDRYTGAPSDAAEHAPDPQRRPRHRLQENPR